MDSYNIEINPPPKNLIDKITKRSYNSSYVGSLMILIKSSIYENIKL